MTADEELIARVREGHVRVARYWQDPVTADNPTPWKSLMHELALADEALDTLARRLEEAEKRAAGAIRLATELNEELMKACGEAIHSDFRAELRSLLHPEPQEAEEQ